MEDQSLMNNETDTGTLFEQKLRRLGEMKEFICWSEGLAFSDLVGVDNHPGSHCNSCGGGGGSCGHCRFTELAES